MVGGGVMRLSCWRQGKFWAEFYGVSHWMCGLWQLQQLGTILDLLDLLFFCAVVEIYNVWNTASTPSTCMCCTERCGIRADVLTVFFNGVDCGGIDSRLLNTDCDRCLGNSF